jgi:aminomethyltransferase
LASTLTALRTPLYEEHLRLKAQMTNFGGFAMPLQYSSIREEHMAVRQAAGMFDLSHMGEIRISGPRAKEFVQHLVTRDIAGLAEGRAQYALLCRDDGGILDDLLVYAEPAGSYLLVVNASNQDPDFEWIRGHAEDGCEVRNVGPDTALIGVQGPRAVEIVQSLADRDLSGVRYYHFVEGRLDDNPCRFSRTGYTGEDGFEIFCGNAEAPRLWTALLEAGNSHGLKPAGLGARDTLRLEAGMRLYGLDMDAQTNPLEAALEWTVSLGKDFIGKAALEQARAEGIKRRLAGLRMQDRSIPRHGYPVIHDGRRVGTVASGNVSFSLGYNIATAYLPPGLGSPGTGVAVQVREKEAPAEVVDLPFYKRGR